jgi:hypothetical protein
MKQIWCTLMTMAAAAICITLVRVNARILARTVPKKRSGSRANPAIAALQNAAARGSAFPNGARDSRANMAADDTASKAGKSASLARERTEVRGGSSLA